VLQHEATTIHDRLIVYEIWRPHEGKVFCVFSYVVANISEEFVMAIFEVKVVNFFFLWRCDPTRVMTSSFLRFLDHTQRRTTVGRTPLDGWSARRRDLYLTTHNIHNRQTSMPPVGLEPTISAGERPQAYALDRAATGSGKSCKRKNIFWVIPCSQNHKGALQSTQHSPFNNNRLTLRRLMSYIYGAPILDVSRSHTTHHSW